MSDLCKAITHLVGVPNWSSRGCILQAVPMETLTVGVQPEAEATVVTSTCLFGTRLTPTRAEFGRRRKSGCQRSPRA
jgi:hypothetical protein